jgi:DNA repair protein RadB
MSIGCNALDGLLQGGIARGEITLLYGEAATGKTTAAIQAAFVAATRGLKVLFIDCDNSFTQQRFSQIGGNDSRSMSEQIMLFFPNTFEEQRTLVESLDNYVTPNLALIIIDSISTLYRAEFQRAQSIFDLNRDLTRQLAYLADLTLSRNLACLITSQVRAQIKGMESGDKIEPVARRALLHFPRTIIRIQSRPGTRVREFILERLQGANTEMHCLVEINERGLVNIS